MATTTAAACCAPLGAPGRPPPGQDPQPAGHQPEPVGVGEVTEPLGWRRPTVSHHPSKLVQAGLLDREQRGTRASSRLPRDALGGLAAALDLQGASRGHPADRPGHPARERALRAID
jgi:hypothetical protein